MKKKKENEREVLPVVIHKKKLRYFFVDMQIISDEVNVTHITHPCMLYCINSRS